MRFLKTMAAVITSFGVAGVASAADLPVKAPPPVAAVYNWSGFYAGLNAGGTWGSTDPGMSVTPPGFSSVNDYFTFGAGAAINAFTVQSVGNNTFHNSGFTGGGQIGYNWQFGSLVTGVEWDFEYFNPKGSRTLVGAYAADAVPFAFTQSSSGSWLTTLRGRIGLAQNNWLLYLTGGVAAAQMSFNSTFLDQETSPPRFSGGLASTVSVSQTRYGAVGGAGFEYGFTPNWSVRAEYLYLVIDRVSTTTTAVPTNGGNPGTCISFCSIFGYNARFAESIARVGVNYRFGY